MAFFYLTLLTSLYTIVRGVYKEYAYFNTKSFLQHICLIAFLTGLCSGFLTGTAYSHGIDFPWYLFSLISFLVIMIVAIVLVGLIKLLYFIKK